LLNNSLFTQFLILGLSPSQGHLLRIYLSLFIRAIAQFTHTLSPWTVSFVPFERAYRLMIFAEGTCRVALGGAVAAVVNRVDSFITDPETRSRNAARSFFITVHDNHIRTVVVVVVLFSRNGRGCPHGQLFSVAV
jgi:hypothetical protein